jgi:cytochrome c oxidase assembly factor CtaG
MIITVFYDILATEPISHNLIQLIRLTSAYMNHSGDVVAAGFLPSVGM